MSTLRILCLMPSIRPGGASRVICTLMSHWAQEGHHVMLATTKRHSADFYAVHPAVERAAVHSPRLLGTTALGNVVQAFWLRRSLRAWAPDVIVSFLPRTDVQAVIATIGLPVPVVVSEHDDPSARTGSRWTDRLRWTLLRRAEAIVVQNDDIAGWMQRRMPGARVTTIANPIAAPDIEIDPVASGDTVLAMGRLSHEKGFDQLLEAFAVVSRGRPGWSLTILGGGPERPRLEACVRRLGLDGSVRLMGSVRDPETYLGSSGLFVCPSRRESFGLALAEAMAAGLPVVAFDCPSGPRHLIRDGRDGILVPPGDVPALAEAMQRCMDDPDLRRRLGRAATEVRERFSEERICERWDALLTDLVVGRRAT